MTFKLPTTVRIGFADYTVVPMSDEEAATADHFGITDVDKLEIRINTGVPEQRQVNVLLHEILHGCWDMADLEDGVSEEKAVTGLSIQLCQAMRDNATLFSQMVAVTAHPLRAVEPVPFLSLKEFRSLKDPVWLKGHYVSPPP